MKPFFQALLAFALAQTLTACWVLRVFSPSEQATTRLAAWNYRHLGVATFDDATYQATGEETARVFTETLARELPGVTVKGLNTRPPEVGFFDIGQTQKMGRTHRVQALVTGRVMLHQWDAREQLAEIVVAARLMDTDRGFIIWARTVTGRSRSAPFMSPNRKAEFRRATASAAKELVHDLLAPPVQSAFLSGSRGRLRDASRGAR